MRYSWRSYKYYLFQHFLWYSHYLTSEWAARTDHAFDIYRDTEQTNTHIQHTHPKMPSQNFMSKLITLILSTERHFSPFLETWRFGANLIFFLQISNIRNNRTWTPYRCIYKFHMTTSSHQILSRTHLIESFN